MRILIVDDDKAILDAMRDAIDETGDIVQTYSNGASALQAVAAFQPHAMLLDLAMPGLDGFQVCKAVRTDPKLAGMKVIAVSGLSDSAIRKETAEAGFDLHLTKPIGYDQLLEVLEMVRLGIRMTEKIV